MTLTATLLLLLLVLVVGLALGLLAGLGLGRAQGRPAEASLDLARERAADQALVRRGLEDLAGQLRALSDQRVSWQAQLAQQVADVRHSTDLLRRETGSLATALRRPQVRGRWGELHLRRAVELAGLVARCDFDEQVVLRGAEGTLRPDLVVHLSGGAQVVVDAKVPLEGFLEATECEDDDERAGHLARHARQLRQHVEVLAAKGYARALPTSPEFVVLFVPGEAFLSAALDSDPALIEYGAERGVVLATPTTLIALLRTVALGWRQDALADTARDIAGLGRDLHDRLATMGSHLDRLGRALGSAVSAYNATVGSLETRVLVSARRLSDLGAADGVLEVPRPVDALPRAPTAAELVEDARSGATLDHARGGVGAREGAGGPGEVGVASDQSA